MPLSAGERLGPYEILAPIGAGGMGEVYRARDPRLNRDVAIKVSNAEFSERFVHEARSIAALNHPHICTLYDVVISKDAPNYLVMEYIEGTPLKGPLPLDQTLKYAAQICDALDAAHKKNITHRDLKPANILVTKAGVKLLDFGLAKMGPAVKADEATVTMALTGKGQVLGTLLYMPPEQVNGQEADARSDIFSFGLVLYEMLTGKRAFEGSTPASVIAAILERPAPSVADVAPPALDRVLKRCLEKDPENRWQSARDLKAELEWITSAPEPGSAAPVSLTTTPRFGKLPWVAAGILAITTAVALGALWRAQKPADRPLARLDVDLGADVSLPAPVPGASGIAISSDGTRLAYASGNPAKLFTRRLEQPKATELPGTEGAIGPFFSPDGQWIGFSSRGKLSKISVEGGAVVALGDVPNFAGASWGEDGKIILSNALSKGLMRIPAEGGPPETLGELGKGEIALGRPQILPGGKAVLFTTLTALNSDTATIEVMTLADRRRKIVSRGGTYGRYLPTSDGAGHLVYLNKGTLFAIPFNLDKLETRGTAVPVVDDVAYEAQTRTAQLDFSWAPSGHGNFVYRRGSGSSSFLMTMQWVDPAGKREPLRAKPGFYADPNVSPDGRRVVLLLLTEGGTRDVWAYDQQRDVMTRLTFGGGPYGNPVWSPDGQYIVIGSFSGGISWTRADGASQPQALTRLERQAGAPLAPSSITLDGTWLAFSEGIAPRQIWTVALENQGGQWKAGKRERFLENIFDEANPAFSPDGRWLAYQSTESGRPEVYVRTFPPPTSGQGGKWQISNNGGVAPRWSRNGHELVYQSGDQILTASYSAKGDSFVAEKPRVWIAKLGGTDWDLAPDGKRVLVLTQVETTEAPKQEHEVVFLQNFFDELRRRVPAGK